MRWKTAFPAPVSAEVSNFANASRQALESTEWTVSWTARVITNFLQEDDEFVKLHTTPKGVSCVVLKQRNNLTLISDEFQRSKSPTKRKKRKSRNSIMESTNWQDFLHGKENCLLYFDMKRLTAFLLYVTVYIVLKFRRKCTYINILHNFLSKQKNKQTNSVALSPRANYTDWSIPSYPSSLKYLEILLNWVHKLHTVQPLYSLTFEDTFQMFSDCFGSETGLEAKLYLSSHIGSYRSSESYSLAFHRGGRGSSTLQIVRFLWSTERHWGRFSPSTSISLSFIYSTKCSITITIYHARLIE
jgi:hypothetical protein